MKAIVATILLMLGIASMVITPITHAEAKPYKTVSEVKLLKKINTSPESKTLQCKKGLVSMINNKKRQICVYESTVEKYTAIGWQLAEGTKQVTVPLAVTTDKDQYKTNQTVDITISNNGATQLFPQGWGYTITSQDGQQYAPNGMLKMMLVALAPGNSVHWSWDQKDSNGTQTPSGKYTVTAMYTDETTNKPMTATKQITLQ